VVRLAVTASIGRSSTLSHLTFNAGTASWSGGAIGFPVGFQYGETHGMIIGQLFVRLRELRRGYSSIIGATGLLVRIRTVGSIQSTTPSGSWIRQIYLICLDPMASSRLRIPSSRRRHVPPCIQHHLDIMKPALTLHRSSGFSRRALLFLAAILLLFLLLLYTNLRPAKVVPSRKAAPTEANK
jgi:hypothetical protein